MDQDLSPEERQEREEHRRQMLGFLARDVEGAKTNGVTIGFRVSERDDRGWFRGGCSRVATLEGLYLPDELPDLYPADCPYEYPCACISIVGILHVDDTEDGRLLREKIAARGLPAPPPPWNEERERAEIEEMERKKFARNPEGLAKHLAMAKKIVNGILGR